MAAPAVCCESSDIMAYENVTRFPYLALAGTETSTTFSRESSCMFHEGTVQQHEETHGSLKLFVERICIGL